MTATDQDATIYAGDDAVLRFTLTDADGDPLNLTGYALAWAMRGAGGAVAVSKSLGSGIALVGAASAGVADVTLTHDDTADLAPIGHRHQLEGTDGSGNVSTLAEGIITVRASVAP